MTILRHRRVWVLIIILTVLLIAPIVVCVVGFSYDAKQEAIDETEQLLSAARKYPTGPLPQNDIPSNMWVSEWCWSVLQNSMLKSSSLHTTTITYYGKESPKYSSRSRDVDEIYLQVDFPGSQSVIIGFYEGGLGGCSLLKE